MGDSTTSTPLAGAEGVLGQPPGQRAQGPYMWSTRDNVEGKAGGPSESARWWWRTSRGG